MNINKIVFSLAGAVTVGASAITLIDYKRRLDCQQIKDAPIGELLLAFATAAGGAALAACAGRTVCAGSVGVWCRCAAALFAAFCS